MTKRPTVGVPVGRIGRAMLIVWAVFLLWGFVVARRLEPDSRGYGTHQQLGLPQCNVQLIFSLPCPGCGMTTSFAHFVRGDLMAAARANPAGLLLAMLCLLLIPWSLISATRGCLWLIDDPTMAAVWAISSIGVVALLSWGGAIWRLI